MIILMHLRSLKLIRLDGFLVVIVVLSMSLDIFYKQDNE